MDIVDSQKLFTPNTTPYGILCKLKHYGIDNKICLWIFNLLKYYSTVDRHLMDVASVITPCTVLGLVGFTSYQQLLSLFFQSKTL